MSLITVFYGSLVKCMSFKFCCKARFKLLFTVTPKWLPIVFKSFVTPCNRLHLV